MLIFSADMLQAAPLGQAHELGRVWSIQSAQRRSCLALTVRITWPYYFRKCIQRAVNPAFILIPSHFMAGLNQP